MPSFLKSSLLAISFVAATVATPVFAQSAQRDLAQENANRTLVVDFYNQFFNKHDVKVADKVVAENYIQHNPQVPDGRAPFVNFFEGYFKDNPQLRANIVRSGTDGDLVFLHVHMTNGPEDRGTAVVDIFRVDDGRIVEHWDVIQAVPETAANENTMF